MAANLGHVLGAGFVNITVNTEGQVYFEAHGSSNSLGAMGAQWSEQTDRTISTMASLI
jgi:hypothetical protein